LLHIDLCHYPGNRRKMLQEARRAIKFALELNPEIQLEIGTDDNRGDYLVSNDIERIEQEVEFFLEFCAPSFYVIQTGSLVREARQIGRFNEPFVAHASKMLERHGLRLKEHNADYLPREEIERRYGVVGAMNIAPQLGVAQTTHVLERCSIYQIDFSDFLNVSYSSGRWRKWLYTSPPEDTMLCALISGHYCFHSDVYKGLIHALGKYEDIHASIVEEILRVVAHYESGQQAVGTRDLARA
jgi:hypothetical protein